MSRADDFIGESLISAIKDILGSAATEEIISAWTIAYAFLANIFIETEKSIKEAAEKQAGYAGFKVRYSNSVLMTFQSLQ